MLPVAVLPVAGLLLGLGATDFHGYVPAIVLALMKNAGDVIFGNLPLIFAIGVALGFTENDGVSGIAATIGYLVMTATLGVIAKVEGVEPDMIMGIPSIQTGVFGGILAGGLAAWMFNRYYRIALPPYLGFFGGKRFVPIVTAIGAIVLGVILSVVWPPIGAAIKAFSQWAAVSDPRTAATVYGFVERLLIPFGLHHIWNVPFFFEAGSFMDPTTGKVVHGDINRFFAGDPTRRHPGGRVPVQDVRPAGRGDRDLALRQAREEGRGRRHDGLGRADLVSHRHHRADRVRLPVRRAGSLLHPRVSRGVGAVRGQHLAHAHGLHILAGRHRLPDVQPDRQQGEPCVVRLHPRTDLRGDLLLRVPLCDHPLQPQDARSRGRQR